MLGGFDGPGSAVSTSGRYVRQQAGEYRHYALTAISLSGYRRTLLDDLSELVKQHQEFGWDGSQAPPLGGLTVARAKQFIQALPEDIPDPELAVSADDASISMEWYGGYRRVASVSINGTNRLAFAALKGTDISNGAYRFSREELPQVVLSAVREILG